MKPRYLVDDENTSGFHPIIDTKRAVCVALVEEYDQAELICQLLNEHDLAERIG